MHVRVLLVAPLAVLLTGCAALSASVPKSAPAGGDISIPWVAATPTGLHQGLATPVEGSLPKRCGATDLRAGFRAYPSDGKLFGDIDFMSQTTECLVAGVPTVNLLTANGHLSLSQATTGSTGSEIVLEPQAGLPVGGPGQTSVRVDWRQPSGGGAGCPGQAAQATTMEVILPDQTDGIRVEHFWVTEGAPVAICPPVLNVGAFQAISVPVDKTHPSMPPLAPRYWKYTVDAPPTAVAGRALPFRVRLENIYYQPLEFKNGCPEYIEDLKGPGNWTSGKIFYVLNCEPIGVVTPGQSVVLEMMVDIPPAAPPGSYTVGWDLDTGDVNYGAAMAQFTLTAH